MNHARSTGVLTTSTLVATGRNYISGLVAGGDGTNVATVGVYDNTSATGTPVLTLIVPAGSRQVIYDVTHSIQVDNGLYVSVSGTGANFMLAFGA